MRFIEDGPSIPDELLNARDQGRVVFFCGAGVSRARADLPDFLGLAEAVIRQLRVPEDNDACKVLKKAREISSELSVTGLISADRVFDLLEREFTPDDVRAAVAKCLTPRAGANLSAHQILLRLAKTPESRTQLVTTNFDRLFERCGVGLDSYQHPHLPFASRRDNLNGIVYLHGRVNDDYSGSDGDDFVLSSSDFGYAYLSEGWATEFFRDIVRRYVVVFIGYSADDPPIHYLLEGFYRGGQSSHSIYAFQAEESDEVIARWQYKGVRAIPYAETKEHRALWETLEQWAQRSDDPDTWRRTVIDLAMAGPERHQPYQRGQIAHIVSTYEGARKFAECKPPAEWLCVFDPLCRYASPRRSKWGELDSPIIDPFSLYGLDSDATPERDTSDNHPVTRMVPTDAWDAFATNDLDVKSLSRESFASVRGYYATRIPRLSKRLECLGRWIADVANQPAAVWWVARQKSLHLGIRTAIEWAVRHLHGTIAPAVKDAWRYLLEAAERIDTDSDRVLYEQWHELKREIDRYGWIAATVRRFIMIGCPYVTADQALVSAPVPPKMDAELQRSDLIRLQVECPVPPHDARIPNEWLEVVIRGLRKNLELAVQLHQELGDSHWIHISPIVPDDRPDTDHYQRARGLSGCVIQFAALFERLMDLNMCKAQQEFASWPIDDGIVFGRLRLWASGKPKLVSPDIFCQIVNELSNDVFWSSYDQRDFLLVLAARWKDLSEHSRRQIEDRLLAGPVKCHGEGDASYRERQAWATLERLQWLADNQCDFSFDVREEIANRRPLAPKWEPKYAKHATESLESRGGSVRTNTEYGVLLREPIGSILSKARDLSGRNWDNVLEERDPFAGLCGERPRRAYLALVHAARQNEYPEWAWREFLASPRREKDEPKCSAAIAERLCRMPDEASVALLYPSTSWLQRIASSLSKQFPRSLDKIMSKFIDVLHGEASNGRSAATHTSRSRDWVTEALNSPAGHIAWAVFEDSRVKSIRGNVDPCANWLKHLAQLLNLAGDARRQAIAIISHRLGWLHRLVPDWTECHLLSILDGKDEEDQESFWDGFLSNPDVASPALYLRLKPSLSSLVREKRSSREGHLQALAILSLSGWITGRGRKEERLISNGEFHDMVLHGGDDFRSRILWQIGQELRNKRKRHRKEWLNRTIAFLKDVWPSERVVKNPTMSARLCELVILDSGVFQELADIILPRLTKITRDIGLHFHLLSERNDIVCKHPKRVLSLLFAILPEDVSDWPYGIGELLESIVAADSSLLSDAPFRELKRKWDAR